MEEKNEIATKEEGVVSATQENELLKEIRSLQETVKKLETDIEDIKYFTPQPQKILDKEVIGTIGGLILGALVIIGIFF
ncbi:hypothetical protein J14TS2_35140 [Bacillus sp. J14TS2]|uniref:hypothetical protein n=1 Tax=unclassified Bacillus (in: firmicutes) TaxID=185979 RepID=UPI001A958984|nr:MULTISPECIES: hypothetical protein [unclassified Bacillus (in: firmicutes)]MBO0992396.1 hypothetical protein [Bacillus sp. SD088]GIN73039.1 hypothetical protein J14TS2_35140 [Bacillus sp. J14TS2]